MRTRNSNFPNNSNVSIPRRRNRGRVPNIVEPELRTIVEVAPMAERTMEELLRAPKEGYGEAIVLPEINADHFDIKTNLLQLVQANPFHGYERENPHAHINSFKRITSNLQFRDVPNDVIKLMMFPYSLEENARLWYEKEPPNSILTWEDLVTKFVNQFFPPLKTTHLKNEISRFTQKIEETFSEAWERFKEMLRACPHHGFTEECFGGHVGRGGAWGGNLLSKTTREALNIIENKSKVRYSRNKPNASRMNTSRESVSKMDERIDKLADQLSTLVEIVSKKVVTPAPVKAVEETCITCSDAHSWYNCPNTDNNHASVCATTGTYNQVNPPNRVSNQMEPPDFAPVQNNGQNRFNNHGQGNNFNRGNNFHGNQDCFKNQTSIRVTISSNTFKTGMGEDESESPTRSGVVMRGPLGIVAAQIPPPVTPISIPESNVPKSLPKPNIPYPLRRDDQNLLMNKEKLLELAKIPLNKNCSAVLLKKLPKKLGDPDKFLIPCYFPGMDVCHTLADLGASINLMPLSFWKNLSLQELTQLFHFPTDFVVVNFKADPLVPLILGRFFLRNGRALIDVYGEEITLRVDNEAITFNLDQTTRYSSTNDKSVNRIDIIDAVYEEYAPELLGFSNSSGGNPTPTFEPFTSEFILEEIEAYLKDDLLGIIL
ncbi:reverse transcriptase domain-containing protein [Tanacetum coccineum]